jgi:hypothetical protein
MLYREKSLFIWEKYKTQKRADEENADSIDAEKDGVRNCQLNLKISVRKDDMDDTCITRNEYEKFI